MDHRLYLLNIRLLDLAPPIWRRFVVPASITLDRLHDIVQIVMGWTDSHLHEFAIGPKRYTECPESKNDGLSEDRYRFGELVRRKGRTIGYTYDFGDYWSHEIVLEDNDYSGPLPFEAPVCLEGNRACPPEDVGGTHGYAELCAALKNPEHDSHHDMKNWIGDDWDSEKFCADEVNRELLKYQRWSRVRRTAL